VLMLRAFLFCLISLLWYRLYRNYRVRREGRRSGDPGIFSTLGVLDLVAHI
jgi:hypothetical protein